MCQNRIRTQGLPVLCEPLELIFVNYNSCPMVLLVLNTLFSSCHFLKLPMRRCLLVEVVKHWHSQSYFISVNLTKTCFEVPT